MNYIGTRYTREACAEQGARAANPSGPAARVRSLFSAGLGVCDAVTASGRRGALRGRRARSNLRPRRAVTALARGLVMRLAGSVRRERGVEDGSHDGPEEPTTVVIVVVRRGCREHGSVVDVRARARDDGRTWVRRDARNHAFALPEARLARGRVRPAQTPIEAVVALRVRHVGHDVLREEGGTCRRVIRRSGDARTLGGEREERRRTKQTSERVHTRQPSKARAHLQSRQARERSPTSCPQLASLCGGGTQFLYPVTSQQHPERTR